MTFTPDYDEGASSPAGLVAGTAVRHPDFGTGGAADTHDIAVVVLEQAPAGITPARLPTAGLLDRLEAGHQPPATTFTAVGYGTVREDETGGPHGFLESDKTYRLDTAAAREFLAPFVTLP